VHEIVAAASVAHLQLVDHFPLAAEPVWPIADVGLRRAVIESLCVRERFAGPFRAVGDASRFEPGCFFPPRPCGPVDAAAAHTGDSTGLADADGDRITVCVRIWIRTRFTAVAVAARALGRHVCVCNNVAQILGWWLDRGWRWRR